jgi:hypothetical protein
MLVLAVAATLLAAGPAAATPAGLPAPKTLTLRLPDLGPNYELWAEGCDRQSLAGRRSPQALRDLARHAQHEAAGSLSAPAGPCRARRETRT